MNLLVCTELMAAKDRRGPKRIYRRRKKAGRQGARSLDAPAFSAIHLAGHSPAPQLPGSSVSAD